MLYFVFQVLVNALAVIVTILLLPGLVVSEAGLFDYLLMGLIFGVLNAFVKPFFVLLSGRYLIRSLGLFTVIINSLLLLLLARIGPGEWAFNSIISVLFGGAVIGVVLAVLDAILGLNRPLLNQIESGQSMWRLLNRLPSTRRNRIIENLRLQQVTDTLWRYGLEIAFSRGPFGAIRSYVGALFHPNAPTVEALGAPAQVRIMVQDLGPTYVKFGQMVSSRSDSLPPEWQQELARLQSDVPPFPTEEAYRIIEEELGRPVSELFATFDLEPLAAASTAQVHTATLSDGQKVVVKVQRPYIVPKVKADLGIIQDLFETMERRFKWARDSDLKGIISEFAVNVIQELDYTNESYNARRLKLSMSQLPEIQVPTIYSKLSSSKVLTMEFVQGVKIVDVEAMDRAGLDRNALARSFLNAIIKQIMIDGFFHGDPHPGNVMVNLENGRIIFLDCGMVGMLDSDQRMNLIDLLWSIQAKDSYEMGTVLLRLSVPFRKVDERQFRRQLEQVIDRNLIFLDESGSFSNVVGETLSVLRQSGLRLNSQLTISLKALIQAEQIVYKLDPNVYLVDTAFGQIKHLVVEQLSVESVTQSLKLQAVRSAKEVVRRLPTIQGATMKWLDQYEKGRFQVEIDSSELNQQLERISFSAERLAIGFVLLGMIIGSGIATMMPGEILGIPFSTIAFILFAVAIAISFVLVFRMWSGLSQPAKDDF